MSYLGCLPTGDPQRPRRRIVPPSADNRVLAAKYLLTAKPKPMQFVPKSATNGSTRSSSRSGSTSMSLEEFMKCRGFDPEGGTFRFASAKRSDGSLSKFLQFVVKDAVTKVYLSKDLEIEDVDLDTRVILDLDEEGKVKWLSGTLTNTTNDTYTETIMVGLKRRADKEHMVPEEEEVAPKAAPKANGKK